MNLLLTQTMAGLTKHKTGSEKSRCWGDTYQSAHVSVSCAICPSPSGVTPLNPSPSHHQHHAGCLQPLDCVGEKVKDYRKKKDCEKMFFILSFTANLLYDLIIYHLTQRKNLLEGRGPGISNALASLVRWRPLGLTLCHWTSIWVGAVWWHQLLTHTKEQVLSWAVHWKLKCWYINQYMVKNC